MTIQTYIKQLTCFNGGYKSMDNRACVNADGEMLILPQLGRLLITTGIGILDVKRGEIALVPRGVAFKVALLDVASDGGARGYVCENYDAHFRQPELGPIGSNDLANARDFKTQVAAFGELSDFQALTKSSKADLKQHKLDNFLALEAINLIAVYAINTIATGVFISGFVNYAPFLVILEVRV